MAPSPPPQNFLIHVHQFASEIAIDKVCWLLIFGKRSHPEVRPNFMFNNSNSVFLESIFSYIIFIFLTFLAVGLF